MGSQHTYGGQAVVEGVMIRGRTNVSVAVRRTDGSIVSRTDRINPFWTGPFRSLPLIRGILALTETFYFGMRSLIFSANIAAESENEEIGKFSILTMLTTASIFAIVVFLLIPLYLGDLIGNHFSSDLIANVIEGFLRLIIFLLYVFLIGLMSDVKRVFMYHGAEHMTVHAMENGDALTTENIRAYPTAHPRCGTAFLLTVMVIAIILFIFIPREPIWWLVSSRIILLPLIASLSYEFIRFTGFHSSNTFVKLFSLPNLALQSLTTRIPDDSQIEVAVKAMNTAKKADDENESLKN